MITYVRFWQFFDLLKSARPYVRNKKNAFFRIFPTNFKVFIVKPIENIEIWFPKRSKPYVRNAKSTFFRIFCVLVFRFFRETLRVAAGSIACGPRVSRKNAKNAKMRKKVDLALRT